MMNVYWKWDDAIPLELLNIADADIASAPQIDGKLGGTNDSGLVDHQVRNSTISAHGPTYWLNAILYNYAQQANIQAGWSRPLTISPFLQYARYTEGQFYTWHADNEILTEQPFQRKLTAILMISNPTDYEGGNLELEALDSSTNPVVLKRGSLIVFPSLLRHRVTPVTKGLRITAVNWTLGPTTW